MSTVQIASETTAVGMKSNGHYLRNSQPQQSAIQRAANFVADFAVDLPDPAHGCPLVLADFGCGQGNATELLLEQAISSLRETRPDVPVWLFRNDLPTSDFNSLATRPFHLPSGCQEALVAGSFRRQLIPKGQLSLGTCFSALHWLDQVPAVAAFDHISHEGANGEIQASFADSWRSLFVSFLTARETELTPGGKLVISLVARPEHEWSMHPPFNILNQAAWSLVEDGHLSATAVRRFAMPIHRPDLTDVHQGLADFSQSRDEFQVLACEQQSAECPFWATWQAERNAENYALRYAEFIRSFSEYVIRCRLLNTARETPAALAKPDPLADCFYERVRRLIRDQPHPTAVQHTRILLALRKCDRT